MTKLFRILIPLFITSITAQTPQKRQLDGIDPGDVDNVLIEDCPDGLMCEHGSKCVPSGNGGETDSYSCDCSTTIGAALYAGLSCEYVAREYCAYGPDSSESFCTNGNCKDIRGPDEDGVTRHGGCDCDEGFEGDFCEFILGQAPKPTEGSGGRSSVYGAAIFFIVVVAISIIYSIVVIARRRMRSRHTALEMVSAVTSDLDMDSHADLNEKEII